MKEYRVTKYNPSYRNDKGYFMKDDWISYGDIGKKFEGKLLTFEDYLIIEDRYIDAVVKTMDFIKVNSVYVSGLEKGSIKYDIYTTEGMKKLEKKLKVRREVNITEVSDLCRLILRNYIWARIECPKMFVHFGYDYYMYLGIKDEYTDITKKFDLFVEPMESPYKLETLQLW